MEHAKQLSERKRTLIELVGDQYLILAVAKTKLDLLNYIKQGYDNNKPVLVNNRFLHYVGILLYRSLIIDFASLFNNDGINEKNNLHLLVAKNSPYKIGLGIANAEKIQTLLSNYRGSNDRIKTIVALRNKEIAHYDPEYKINDDGSIEKLEEERVTIRFNLHHVELLNELFLVGKNVIDICGKEMNMGYNWRVSQKVDSLDRLIKLTLR